MLAELNELIYNNYVLMNTLDIKSRKFDEKKYEQDKNVQIGIVKSLNEIFNKEAQDSLIKVYKNLESKNNNLLKKLNDIIKKLRSVSFLIMHQNTFRQEYLEKINKDIIAEIENYDKMQSETNNRWRRIFNQEEIEESELPDVVYYLI